MLDMVGGEVGALADRVRGMGGGAEVKRKLSLELNLVKKEIFINYKCVSC